MNRLVTLLFCFLFFGTLIAQDIISGEEGTYTQISGTIRNWSARTVDLSFFSDMISFAEEQYQVPLDSTDRFCMRFQLHEPTPVNFEYMGQSIRFFLQPGDDLQLRFDGANFYKTLVIHGKGDIHNYYLQQASRLFGHWDEAHILYEITARSPSEFRRYMDGLRRQKWSFLKQFPGKEKFSNDFLYYASADIDYWWAYFLLRYRLEHYVAQGLEEEELPAHYYDFLNELVISNDRATSNPYYLFFLDQYLLFLEGYEEADSAMPVNIRIDVPSLLIMSEPNQQPIVTEVKKGDRVLFLNEKSDFKSKIQIKEALHEDYWYKVKTGDGHVGWAIGVGLVFEKTEPVDSSALVKSPERKRYRTALQHLKGKALYYTLANDIYFRAQNMPLEKLEKEVREYTFLNPIKSYDQILKHTLESAQIKEKPEGLTGATNYRIISKPEILSAKAERGLVVNNPIIAEEKEEIKTNADSVKSLMSLVIPNDVVKLLDKIKDEARLAALVEKNDEKVVAAMGIQQRQVISTKQPSTIPTDYIDIPLPAFTRPTSPATIKGKLENYTGKTLKLVLYTDPITFGEAVHELKLKPDNSFARDLDLTGPQFGYLAYGANRTQIYIEPGDQLHIKFNAIHFDQTLYFSGKGNIANNYLLAKRKHFLSEEEDLRKQMKDSNPEAFLKYMKTQQILRLEFLGNYQNSYDLSAAFAAYAKAEVDYWCVYQLMNYPWEHPLYHDQETPMKVPVNYYDFLQKVEISNAEALSCQQYIYFLDQYFDYLSDFPENKRITKMQLAEQYLYGEVLSFYKARLYTIACRRGKAKANGRDIRNFIASCENETYNDVLRLAYNEAKGLVNGSEAPLFTLMDMYGRSVNLSDYKGKIVYLDFWASWCSPCVMQMRNSTEWKSSFKGKDVVFIYVSLDKNTNDWRNFVKTLNTSKGIHLIADSGNVYQSKIAKLYHVKRLPTVFILNKEGKVYYNSAKDTTQQRLSEMINNLLLLN